MINKRKIHYWWRLLKRIKTWHLVVLLVVFGVLSVELLRQNNLNMIEKRNLVKMADEKGEDSQTEQALKDLQSYISSHMNTDMGSNGIYLEHTYQRAYDNAVQESLKDDSVSRSLYNKADAECQSTFNKTYSFPAYTQCVAEKLANASANDPLESAKVPSVNLYRYNFISPIWSPDLAGFSVLFTGFILLILLGRAVSIWTIYLILRTKN